jgi:hypothetical protein
MPEWPERRLLRALGDTKGFGGTAREGVFSRVKLASASRGVLFWELLDLSESERKFCPSNGHKRPQLEKKNVEFLPKKAPYLLFPFSCNTCNVFRAAVSTVITDLMAK